MKGTSWQWHQEMQENFDADGEIIFFSNILASFQKFDFFFWCCSHYCRFWSRVGGGQDVSFEETSPNCKDME